MEHDPKEFQSVSKKDLPIFIKWMDFLKWLLVTVDGFPKKARFNFSDRLTNLSLQIAEDLVEARYNKNKSVVLRRANMNLEKIRILMRICFELRFLSRQGYEHSSMLINEVGKMLGGWLKQQQDDYEKTR